MVRIRWRWSVAHYLSQMEKKELWCWWREGDGRWHRLNWQYRYLLIGMIFNRTWNNMTSLKWFGVRIVNGGRKPVETLNVLWIWMRHQNITDITGTALTVRRGDGVMKEPIHQKIKRIVFYPLLRMITGHKYDCCNAWCKRCSRCKYVMDEVTEWTIMDTA